MGIDDILLSKMGVYAAIRDYLLRFSLPAISL